MGTTISRQKENRMQKRLREAGKMKSAVEGFKSAARKTSNQLMNPHETSTTTSTTPMSVSTHLNRGQATTGKQKPWKFPFQKRQPKHTDVEVLTKTRKSDLEQIASLERTSPGQIAHNIVYENILEQDIDTDCYLCRIVKRKPLIECRVCNRLVHRDCLNARGYLDTENQKLSAYRAEQDPSDGAGWSCPDCEDLSQLLSADEMQNIIEKFDKYDINGDDRFDFQDFQRGSKEELTKKTSNSEISEDEALEEEFSKYDRNHDNIVVWEEFKLIEAIDILKKRLQSSLVRSLKPNEIEKMKNCFREQDTFCTGVITMEASKRVIQTWTKKMELTVPQNTSSHKDLDFSLVSWDRFIREHAFAIICARPNTVTIPSYVTSFG